MRVILIRHAHTAGNGAFYVGREDIGLDALGRSQAMELAKSLGSIAIDRLYASPLRRAIETAEAVASGRGLPVLLRAALAELDFGAFAGCAKQDVSLSIRRQHLLTPVAGGESIADVWHRLVPFAEEIRHDLRCGRQPAVVGHYWSNRVLFDMLRAVPFEQVLASTPYKPANASCVMAEAAPATAKAAP